MFQDLVTLILVLYAANYVNAQTGIYRSGRRLTRVPDDIPGDVTHVVLSRNLISKLRTGGFLELTKCERMDLSNNIISVIEPGAFDGLGKLKELHLEHNSIQDLKPGAFAGLLSLKGLDLDFNYIVRIDRAVFADLPRPLELNLNHNMLKCKESLCNGWLKDETEEGSITLTGWKTPICDHYEPLWGRDDAWSTEDKTMSEWDCAGSGGFDFLWLLLPAMILLLVGTVLVVWCLYKKRWKPLSSDSDIATRNFQMDFQNSQNFHNYQRERQREIQREERRTIHPEPVRNPAAPRGPNPEGQRPSASNFGREPRRPEDSHLAPRYPENPERNRGTQIPEPSADEPPQYEDISHEPPPSYSSLGITENPPGPDPSASPTELRDTPEEHRDS